jgi:hypothetical protein
VEKSHFFESLISISSRNFLFPVEFSPSLSITVMRNDHFVDWLINWWALNWTLKEILRDLWEGWKIFWNFNVKVGCLEGNLLLF